MRDVPTYLRPTRASTCSAIPMVDLSETGSCCCVTSSGHDACFCRSDPVSDPLLFCAVAGHSAFGEDLDGRREKVFESDTFLMSYPWN